MLTERRRLGRAVLPVLLIAAACSTSRAAPLAAGPGRRAFTSPAAVLTPTASPTPPTPTPTETALSSTPSTTPPPPPPPPDPAQQKLATLSLPQRVGQLFMVAASDTGPDPSATSVIDRYGVGSVILMGRSGLTVTQIGRLTARLQDAALPGAKLLVATDQEGGQVKRLTGPGFGAVPAAVQQSRRDPARLREDWSAWAGTLRTAGINLNLAPVGDTVPAGKPNPPIGDLGRQYGSTPERTAANVMAVLEGMHDAGVQGTVKHFPGLGRVTANTDYSADVVDSVTVPDDRYLQPFAAAVTAGGFVMVSTAVYRLIDATQPAAFSPTVIATMLRSQLGYQGVVVSDDLGHARQVSYLSPAERAVRFLAAGGDIVLTVAPWQIPSMTAAVIARAQSDPQFGTLVDTAALRVLQAKSRLGLLS